MGRLEVKHKWHKEIKAWADGAEIEVWDIRVNDWVIADQPSWNIDPNVNIKYRIKPQPKEPKYLYVFADEGGINLSQYKSVFNNGVQYIGKIKLEIEE